MREVEVILEIAKDATDLGMAAIEEADRAKKALDESTKYMRDHCVTKAASANVAAALQAANSAGLSLDHADLATHEGALSAVEKLAAHLGKNTLAELFHDPHGRSIPRRTESSSGTSGQNAWQQAIDDVKNDKH